MSIEASLDRRIAIHAALAERYRLSIVDELIVSDRSPSELRHRLGIESNLLAHHLAVLEQSGLIERVGSAGDRRRRYVRLLPGALAMAWEPTISLAASAVLFVCTANSARSQLAAALWNARHDVAAASAGTQPAARVHPGAIKAGTRAGLDLGGAAPRGLDDIPELPELIVTVCDRAREDLARRSLNRVVLHWSIPDPAEDRRPSAFDTAVRRLSVRVGALAPLVSRPTHHDPTRGGRIHGNNRPATR